MEVDPSLPRWGGGSAQRFTGQSRRAPDQAPGPASGRVRHVRATGAIARQPLGSGVKSVAAHAQSIQRGNAERTGEVAVAAAADRQLDPRLDSVYQQRRQLSNSFPRSHIILRTAG